MIEYILLKLLLKKDYYNQYISFVDLQFVKDSSIELYYIYLCLNELHESFEKDLTLDELVAFFYAKYPDANKDRYSGIFDAVQSSELGEDVGSKIISKIKQRNLLLKLSEKAYAATQLADSSEAWNDIQKITAALSGEEKEVGHDETFVTTDLEEILNDTYLKPGLRWPLDCLNKSIGSLRTGDFGFIFARPETGKTTFLACAVGEFLRQTTRPIVWFNNEEQGKKVILRIIQSYFGLTKQQLLANLKVYRERFQQEVGHLLLLKDDASITKDQVERICERYKPGLIIYDQIDKIKGFKADRDDLVYGAIYQWARELAKQYAPSIGVCQADGTAEGQKWLSMANVANAKTSKQAEADWILGIGKTHDEASENVRYLNISKNKLDGDEDSIPELRHGRFEVLIEPQIARYRDVIKYG